MTIITGKEKKDYKIGAVGIQLDEDVKAEQLLQQQNGCMSLYVDPMTGIAAPKPGPQPFALAMFMEMAQELEALKKRIEELEDLIAGANLQVPGVTVCEPMSVEEFRKLSGENDNE